MSSKTKKPNILLFMSDQHTPYYSGYYGHNVETPNIDSLVEDGTCFNEAYTVCPLCVPSRVAMLSSLRPSKTGVFGLDDALSDMTPTFLHYLVESGYETVLVGRMHFVGRDQRHGFTKRIAPDCTTITWNRPEQLRESRGVYYQTYSSGFANVVGGGESPSEYYDKLVIDKALEYLQGDYEKPQFIVVSIYAPHHPYVGPKELYEKYQKLVSLPETYHDKVEPVGWRLFKKDLPEDLHLDIAAAYSALIEEMDERLGKVRKAFDDYCDRQDSKRAFIYLSDHGDMMGDRGSYNKQTFYEKSAKIPLVFAGDGIMKNHIVDDAVNIMDVGPTILELAGAEKMREVDGVSLYSALKGKPVKKHACYGEFVNRVDNKHFADRYCFMLKEKQYKYLYFEKEKLEYLFDTVQDPDEMKNLVEVKPEIYQQMRSRAKKLFNAKKATKLALYRQKNTALWKAYENATGSDYDSERYQEIPPKEVIDYPENMSPHCLKG